MKGRQEGNLKGERVNILRLAQYESLQENGQDEHAQADLLLQQHEVNHDVRTDEGQFTRVHDNELTD